MLRKLLFQNQDRKQLIIAITGAFLGITFLITSIHYLIKVNEFGEGAEILGPNTVIVQKRVSTSTTFNLTKTDFSSREIEKIKAESFVADVKPVISNNFDVSFETADPQVPRFRSDVFVQTLDPKFLDVKSDKWHWKPGEKIVPIILPRDFLVMLNTFMSAQGIPQVSDELAMQLKFKFTLSNDKSKEWVDAQIIGFTNEVPSILVPESFMEYGNKEYSLGKEQKITQIMISGRENEFGKVEQLMKERGLESKNSQIIVGRLKSMVGTLFLVVLGISIIAVFVSGLVLIQYMQLLMSKNAYEVKTLLRIGYHPKDLTKQFFFYFVKVFGVVAFIGTVVFLLLKFYLDDMFETGGIYIDTGLSYQSFTALLITFASFTFASFRTAKNGIFSNY
ncbi:MAG: FtsX-like permease family protein [Bacteroidota bacterium]